jgi:tetratricopeptide (TPR) repeat protein
MPVCFAVGAAMAPALLRPAQPPRRTLRIGLAIGAGLLAIWMLPYLFSERYTNDALRTGQADPEHAYAELQDAADLNPASDRPLATEAVIAESAGDRQRALAALDEAEKRVPDEWTLYYLEARVLAPIDPAGAVRALTKAKELNPRGPEVDALAQELGIPL